MFNQLGKAAPKRCGLRFKASLPALAEKSGASHEQIAFIVDTATSGATREDI